MPVFTVVERFVDGINLAYHLNHQVSSKPYCEVRFNYDKHFEIPEGYLQPCVQSHQGFHLSVPHAED